MPTIVDGYENEPIRLSGIIDRLRRDRFIILQNQRKNFIKKVYLLAMLCVCITFLHWMTLILDDNAIKFFKDNSYITFISTIFFVVLMTLFALIDEIRYNPPYNWIFAFFIIEFATFGFFMCPLYASHSRLGICFLITIALFALFVLIGSIFPADITVLTAALAFISSIVYFVSFVYLILSVCTDTPFPSLYFIGSMMILIAVYATVDAQLIGGKFTYAFRFNDYVLAALILYFGFTVMYCFILYVAKHLYD